TGCTIEWEPIKYVVDTLAISYMGYLHSSRDSLETNCDRIVQYIRVHKPLFFAPCFDGLDGTGHSAGWYSRDYYDYLARLDKCIGRIIQALKDAGIYDETVIIVTGDHGGHDKGHGTLAMEDMESPLVFFGKNVKQGYQIQSPVVQYDIAATIAYALGIEIPQVWRGKPVKEAFR
ncbi:MAG: alkaline phosphatase, partial [Bacteroidales bacterium]|nr:alkaline phosphatase [Bacteroidales bacterium]